MSTVTGKCVHDLNNNELHIVYINICKAWVPVRAGQSSNKLKNSIIPYKELYSKTTFRRRHLSNFSNQSAHSNFIIDQWHSSRQIRQGLHFQLSSFQRYNIHYSAFVAYSHFPNPHYPLLKLFSFQKAELESGKLESTTLRAWWLYIEFVWFVCSNVNGQ